MMNLLDQSFLELSTRLGSNPMLIQGGGGNTSIKSESCIWIKASGKWLMNAKSDSMFIPLDYKIAMSDVKSGDDKFRASRVYSDNNELRPSIETAFHVMIPYNVVLHVHSINVLVWSVQKYGRSKLQKLLKGLDWAWVDYVKPGIQLSQEIELSLKNKAPHIFILENHGLIIAGDNCADAEALLLEVERRLTTPVKNIQSSNNILLLDLAKKISWSLPLYEEVHCLGIDSFAFKTLLNKPLYPDHVVFLGSIAPVVHKGEDPIECLLKYNNLHKCSASYLVVEGQGVLVSPSISQASQEMLLCLAKLMMRLPSNEELRYLTNNEVMELVDWDAEKYRKELVK